MDKSVYSTEKISTGLAVSLETDQSSTRQFTILIRYLGAFDSLQEIAVFPIVPLLNHFAVGTASKEEILRLTYMPEVLYIDLTRQMEYEQAVQAEDRIAACFPMYDEQESVLRGNGISHIVRREVKAENDYELRQKLTKYALGRGFGYEVIHRCIDGADELLED
jgi:hypothetical protein